MAKTTEALEAFNVASANAELEDEEDWAEAYGEDDYAAVANA